LPHLPDPDERESVVEKRCAGCGAWNHSAELRCQRCGRKLETLLGADARRELEETESLPGPTLAAAAIPRPAAEPEWKQELNRRLAGYREKQAAFNDTAEIAPSPETKRHRLEPPVKSGEPAHTLPPPKNGAAFSPLPPIRGPFERAERPEQERPPIRMIEPPIVDRLLHAQESRATRQRRRTTGGQPASLKSRFIAGLLDVCVVALALGVFVAVTHFTNPLILTGPDRWSVMGGAFAVLLVIYWVAYLRLMGSTAGMHWTGLRVWNLDSQPPDTQQRWTRAFGTVLSAAALGVGFLWSIFDEQHFTWHDRVSKTFVGLDG
jgi:uncharacterized RDD family membrane protein YckC